MYLRECYQPCLPLMHHLSLHILPLIFLRINILEINRRHISTSKWKTSWTEQGKRIWAGAKLYFKDTAPLFRGVFVTPEQGGGDLTKIWSSSLAFSKVSLTICKSEISLNKPKLKQTCVFFPCNLMMYWSWGQGQGSLGNHVLSLFTLTSKKANQRYMISPSLQLTGPFDVGNHVTSAFRLDGLTEKEIFSGPLIELEWKSNWWARNFRKQKA